jgi:hypothetical protein
MEGAACITAASTARAALLLGSGGSSSAAPSSLVLRVDCLVPEGCAEYAPLGALTRPFNCSSLLLQHINLLPVHAGLRSADFLRRLHEVS